jgi:hypothetical protein
MIMRLCAGERQRLNFAIADGWHLPGAHEKYNTYRYLD